MNQKPCQFYSFLQAVRGNWRNALFIRCSGSLCPMTVSYTHLTLPTTPYV